MSKHRLRSKNFTNVKELYSGKYIRQCSCINHEEWSFNEIYQLVNIKKSTRFGKNVIKKMRKVIYCRSFQMFCVHSVIQSTRKGQ